MVLLADGSSKPIEKVTPGDTVLATDPVTGRTDKRQVTHTIRTDDDKQFVDVTIAKQGTGDEQTVTTTEHHPFWSVSQGRWVDAGSLKTGELLRTSAGTYVQITAIHKHQAHQITYDLTVDVTHTYYVVAGATPVLVHNNTGNPGPGCSTGGGGGTGRQPPADDNYRGRYNADLAANGQPRLPDHWDAHHRIPRMYSEHPEFADFDFHSPSNIRGVIGNRLEGGGYQRRGPGNIHDQITQRWDQFAAGNPTATRSQIEDFAVRIDAEFEGFWWR